MKLADVLGISWLPYAAGAVLVLAVVGERHWHGSNEYQRGRKDLTNELAKAALTDTTAKLAKNEVSKAAQVADNKDITKDKHEELTPVVKRITESGRLRSGSGLCPKPAARPEASGPGSSDSTDPASRLVREDVDRDIKSLMIEVENHLATGRACQSFLEKNGLTPTSQ